MPDAPEDKEALEDALNALIACDLPVTRTGSPMRSWRPIPGW